MLSTKVMRELYDEHGAEAVQASWTIGQYTGSQSDRERILEAIRRSGKRRMTEVRSSAVIETAFDASCWFDEYPGIEMAWHDYVPSLNTTGLTQSFETYVTPDTLVELIVTVQSKNGTGQGNTRLTVSHQLNPTIRVDSFLTLGNQKSLSFGAARAFSNGLMLNGRVIGQVQQGYLFPIVQFGMTRVLLKGLVASTTLVAGAQNSFIVNFANVDDANMTQHRLTLEIGRENGIKLKSNTSINDALGIGLKANLSNQGRSSIGIGLNKQWNPIYKSAAFLECDMEEGGVVLKLSLSRLDEFKFTLPIRLSTEITNSSILFGAAIPAVAGYLLDRLVVKPILRYIDEQDRLFEQEKLEQNQRRREEEALLISDVLSSHYERRLDQETKSNGLVIEEAAYEASEGSSLDVKIPIQVMVSESQLLIPGGTSKSGILGFYDIKPGTTKHLRIRYRFRGALHETTFEEFQQVILPQRHHKKT